MNLEIELWDMMIAFTTIGSLAFAATWTLLHRMVFRPLDTISKELRDVKDFFGPRIATLETKVDNLEKTMWGD